MPTTIKLRNSVTTTSAPSSLAQGEVAINITDKKVWVGNAATTPIQLLGAGSSASFGALTCTSLTNSGLTSGRVTYASTGGLLTDSANMTFNGTTLTVADFTDSSLTANRVVYATTAGNLTTSANLTFNGTTLTTVNDASISGLTVGKGTGSGNAGNTALGYLVLPANTTGASNTGAGYLALNSNTTGSNNIAFGSLALTTNTTGSTNTAIGNQALISNTTASNNTAVGYQAGYSNTTGSLFTAIGYQAGYSSNYTSGNAFNAFLGDRAGYSTTTGISNTFVGSAAGYDHTTGTFNTFVGASSGNNMTTGGKNTIIGRFSGNQGGLDIRTASNWIVLSDGDGNPRINVTSAGNVLISKVSNDDTSQVGTIFYSSGPFVNACDNANQNTISLYNKNATNNGYRFYVNTNGGIYNFSGNNVNLSDERTKKNIESAGSYLNKICAIPVKTFNYKDEPSGEQKTLGVIAQDVEQVAPEFVNNNGWQGIEPEDGVPIKTIYTTDMMFAMMKAIQELKAEVDSLKAQLNK